MRWPVFAIFAFAAVVLQLSTRSALRLYSLGSITPDLVACLIVFIALFAQRTSTLWACLLLGLAMDLSPSGADAAPVIGPYALGYVFGGYIILQLRTMVFRRRAITLGFLTALCVAATSVVVVAIIAIRSWYPGSPALPHGALGELLYRFAEAVYSGLIGIPVGWLLCLTLPLWGFQAASPRRTAW
jgi:rod shape-determining protein MreD